MRFDPQPGDWLTIGDENYRFTPHPSAGMSIAYAQEGRKAIVYQLRRSSDDRLFALKVFKPAFRGDYLVEVARRIAPYAGWPGMIACQRTVLTREQHRRVLTLYPELEYAVLMPWVADQTWQNILILNRLLSYRQSLELAGSLAAILRNLEAHHLAHCDISGGNVLVDSDRRRINLVDLEDMYGADLPMPVACPTGTPGYQHRTSRRSPHGQWQLYGDRFAGAVLLAEILASHDPQVLGAADAEHYFAEDEMQSLDCVRYTLMVKALTGISVQLAKLFEQAWSSSSLADCPSFDQWTLAIAEARRAADALEAAAAQGSDRQLLATCRSYSGFFAGFQLAELGDHTFLVHQHVSSSYSRLVAGVRLVGLEARVELARQRLAALEALFQALDAGDDECTWERYRQLHHLLDGCQDFGSGERARLAEVRHRVAAKRIKELKQALWLDDDARIESAYDALLFDGSPELTQAERCRCELAVQRMAALRALRTALENGDPVRVAEIYQQHADLLRSCSAFTAKDRAATMQARRQAAWDELRAVLAAGRDPEMVTAARLAIQVGQPLDWAVIVALHAARRRLAELGGASWTN